MKVSILEYSDLTNENVDKILYEEIEDTGEKGDCILVFGSTIANKYRVPKAVELYKNGRAPKIIFSGGASVKTSEGMVLEADMMKQKAIELGVPEEDIIIETFSYTTKENVIGSMIVLDRQIGLCRIKRILAVSTEYHMKRCKLMLEMYMPEWISFTTCPAKDQTTTKENWYKTEVGYKRAKMEAYKISSYIREGSLEDFEI